MGITATRYTTHARALRALDRQPVNGFAVEVGAQEYEHGVGRYFVSRPAAHLWLLHDRGRVLNDPVLSTDRLRTILDYVFA